MTTEQAWKIVGNQSKYAIKNMIKALTIMKTLNSPEENLRLQAAKICMRTKNPKYL